MPERGWDAVTIPGAVSGWVALSKRYGKLPFADLFGPAIRYARDGWHVSPVVAEKWALAAPIMPTNLGWPATFMPQGRVPRVGERFTCPAMADSLEKYCDNARRVVSIGVRLRPPWLRTRSPRAAHIR